MAVTGITSSKEILDWVEERNVKLEVQSVETNLLETLCVRRSNFKVRCRRLPVCCFWLFGSLALRLILSKSASARLYK